MSKPSLQTMIEIAARTYADAVEVGVTKIDVMGAIVNSALEEYIKNGNFSGNPSYKFAIQGDGEGNIIPEVAVKAHFQADGLHIEIVEKHITTRNVKWGQS